MTKRAFSMTRRLKAVIRQVTEEDDDIAKRLHDNKLRVRLIKGDIVIEPCELDSGAPFVPNTPGQDIGSKIERLANGQGQDT